MLPDNKMSEGDVVQEQEKQIIPRASKSLGNYSKEGINKENDNLNHAHIHPLDHLQRKGIQIELHGWGNNNKNDAPEKDASDDTSPSSSPDPTPTEEEDSSTSSSSDWETEDEEISVEEDKDKPLPKTRTTPPPPEDEEDDTGYVPLRSKIGGEFKGNKSHQSRTKKRVTWADGKCPNRWRQIWGKGADLDDLRLPTPLLNLDHDDASDDLLERIKDIGQILHNPELSISQKYRSLGVEEEDPYQDHLQAPEDSDVPCSCWSWLKYKLSQLYSAQWPIFHLPEGHPALIELGQRVADKDGNN